MPPASPTLPVLVAAARRSHHDGRLGEAEQLCRQALAIAPDHAESLHLLGLTMARTGRSEPAIDLIGQAIAIDPNTAFYHSNLGNLLRQHGKLDEAVAAFHRALELRPEFPEARNNLGNALNELGRLDEAVACFHRALAMRPNYAEATNNLGDVLRRLDRLEEAAACFHRAIALQPDYPEAHYNLGRTLLSLGSPEEAETRFRTAVALRPDYPEAHNHLGVALNQLDQPERAAECFQTAIALRPNYPEAHYNLGNALLQLGRPEEAAAGYRAAIAQRPEFPEAHNNLGNALQRLDKLEEAVIHCREALRVRPDYPEACYNLGNALLRLWRLNEAAASFRRAIDLQPAFPEALNNLGNTLKEQGRVEEAIALYEQALRIGPDSFLAFSSLLFASNYLAHESALSLRAKAERFGAQATSRVGRAFTEWGNHQPDEPLRVGLVSGDLGNHPVGYFLEGLLRAADPRRIAFLAFPTQPANDELTARIRPYFVDWRPIDALTDAAAANLIHASGIHVLLDLSGHTAHNRLPVFAWRPAPVQASWLGYFATTGVAEIDYIIGDNQVAPAAEADHFTETIWTLPETYLCFTPPAIDIAVADLPAASTGRVTFGCFNNLNKLNDAVVAVWARVLHAVDGSRLLLKAFQLRDPTASAGIRARFAAHGVDGDRLLTEPPSSRIDYLAAYHRVDIALDPFPYPGGTTSAEALWMGVPVLTRRGNRFLAHAGETIVGNVGLADWIADDEDKYLALAKRFATDLDQLAALRARLRGQVLASPLFDAERFARNFEAAMWGMWRRRVSRR